MPDQSLDDHDAVTLDQFTSSMIADSLPRDDRPSTLSLQTLTLSTSPDADKADPECPGGSHVPERVVSRACSSGVVPWM
jgi:hypothetical protein